MRFTREQQDLAVIAHECCAPECKALQQRDLCTRSGGEDDGGCGGTNEIQREIISKSLGL